MKHAPRTNIRLLILVLAAVLALSSCAEGEPARPAESAVEVAGNRGHSPRAALATYAEPPTLTTSGVIDWQAGDLTGDGRADLVTWASGDQPAIRVAASTGSGLGAERQWGVEICATCFREVADVNGDGKDDLVSFAWGETEQPGWADVSVSLSSGSGLGGWQVWHSSFCIREQFCQVADVNGDAKADLVAFTPFTGKVWVSLSDGSKFGENSVWQEYFCIVGEQCRIGDTNGDDKADIIAFKPKAQAAVEKGNVLVALSAGDGFGTAQLWHGYFCIDNEQCIVGDLDGDNRTDIFLQKDWTENYHQALSALSNGSQFVNNNPVVWSDAIYRGTGQLADVTGDGMMDLMVKRENSGGGDTFVFYPASPRGGCITYRDPYTGSCGTSEPNPEPPPGATGYSKLEIWNCHTERRSVTVYVNGSPTTVDPHYNSLGICDERDENGAPLEPVTVELDPGLNEIAIVDPGQTGCEGRDDPTYQACLRQTPIILPGDADGPVYQPPAIN
jgi:hypothetical protein